MNRKEQIILSSLKILPQNYLSWLFGKVASIKWPTRVNQLILKKFCDHYQIDLSELDRSLDTFDSLQSFFTRTLKSDARPIDHSPDTIISPCDGVISQLGKIDHNRLIQVKGFHYTLENLLKDDRDSERFQNGSFCTIYLSPKNYHRVHSPRSGVIKEINYIKGKLFPVNTLSVNNIDQLFVINERVITYLEDPSFGSCAVIMVGATNVGSISLSFTDLVTNRLGIQGGKRSFNEGININRGEELGCFQFGSTVVLLFEKDRVCLELLQNGAEIKMGAVIATLS